MKKITFAILALSTFWTLKSNGQNISYSTSSLLLKSAERSDVILNDLNFKHSSVSWDNEKPYGFLLTEYTNLDKSIIIEIGSSTENIRCTIITKNKSYINELIKDAKNDGFVIIANKTKANGLPIMKKGPLDIAVVEYKGKYRFNYNRNFK